MNRCPDCDVATYRLVMPNRGWLWVLAEPVDLLVDPGGPVRAYTRTCTLIRGELLRPEQAERCRAIGRWVERVWLPHPRHPAPRPQRSRHPKTEPELVR